METTQAQSHIEYRILYINPNLSQHESVELESDFLGPPANFHRLTYHIILKMFTGAIKLANIDDYITPSQECVKPLMQLSNQPVLVEPNILKTTSDGKATVSLTDCLACSGCVTSAQTILMEQMSIRQFKQRAKTDPPILIMSPQSRGAIAQHLKVKQQEVLPRLKAFLGRYFGAEKVYQTIQGINFAHVLALRELDDRIKAGNLPVLSSECPGWVCYAQKTTSQTVVKHMSNVKSPQQIMGSLIRIHERPKGFIVAVMPCPDKKLQAIRFADPEGQKEVDLVLSTTELIDLIANPTKGCECPQNQCGCCQNPVNGIQQFLDIQLDNVDYGDHYLRSPELPRHQSELQTVEDPKANGYLFYLMRSLKGQNIKTRTIKNSDFIQHTMLVNNQQVKMAQCYGFRNIQTIVRQIKNGKCPYFYVQIMACPLACVNGGGQPKQPETKPREVAQLLEGKLSSLPVSINQVTVEGQVSAFTVQYKALEKSVSAVINDW